MKAELGPEHFGKRLCFVDGNGLCYFTSLPLTGPERQWGDDWNDAPYEHNAGPPYGPGIVTVYVQHYPWDRPGSGRLNSGWSVEAINSGEVAWLIPQHGAGRPCVMAGTTLEEFVAIMLKGGAKVFLPMKGAPDAPG